MQVGMTENAAIWLMTLLPAVVSATLIVRYRVVGVLLGFVAHVLAAYVCNYMLGSLIPGWFESRSYISYIAGSSIMGFRWCLAVSFGAVLYESWKNSRDDTGSSDSDA